MSARAWALLVLAGLALGTERAWAQAPEVAPRPHARAEAETPAPSPRPSARPKAASIAPPVASDRGAAPLGPAFSALAVARAVVPAVRPREITERAIQVSTEAARGQVCGNPAIQGEVEATIGDGGGCGIGEPVRIRSIDGVRLTDASLMDCTTAEALLTWVRRGARPAIASRGGGLAGIDVMGHYACRPRNNQAGARLSEHGRGRAIDVGGLILADGSTLSVLRDWPDPALRQMHSAACGPFSTVLGPAANAQHRDHFHFDTAQGRGPYCR